ncbi:MAG: hypothetical protein KDD53_08705, partial [Bdellovibrionales bacterium]|nr:hypothetical protein [Bdellovibrionales bacterium]
MVRIFLLFLSCFFAVLLVAFSPLRNFALTAATDVYERFMYERELRINGVSVIALDEVRQRMPTAKSNIWWHMFPSEIESSLMGLELIASVSLDSCSGGWLRSWGCFEVNVKERTPAYFVEV